MEITYTKNFLRNYKRRIILNKSLDNKFKQRLGLFLQDPRNPTINDHKLAGAMKELRAFSITGNVRVIYRSESNKATFIDIGTHNQVY